MTTIIIFWAVLLAVIFFGLSLVFNAIGAIMEALLEVVIYVLIICGIVIAGFIAANIIFVMFTNEGGMLEAIVAFIIICLVFAFIIGLLMTFCGWIFAAIASVAIFIVTCIYDVSQICAILCGNTFNYFMTVVTKRVNIN